MKDWIDHTTPLPPFEAGKPGPACYCQRCRSCVETYTEITAGQREYRCSKCHRAVKRLQAVKELVVEADNVLPLVTAPAEARKDFVSGGRLFDALSTTP